MSKNNNITWKSFFNLRENKDATHVVTNIFVDSFNSTVHVTLEHGVKVENIGFSMEQAQEIGFINIKALELYCK